MTPSLLSEKEVPAALNKILNNQFGDDNFSGLILQIDSQFFARHFMVLPLFITKNVKL